MPDRPPDRTVKPTFALTPAFPAGEVRTIIETHIWPRRLPALLVCVFHEVTFLQCKPTILSVRSLAVWLADALTVVAVVIPADPRMRAAAIIRRFIITSHFYRHP